MRGEILQKQYPTEFGKTIAVTVYLLYFETEPDTPLVEADHARSFEKYQLSHEKLQLSLEKLQLSPFQMERGSTHNWT